jgi:HEAT repeat protein
MDRPNLNFDTDESAYYLWREGARLLGDLRATEALDLLISHLDLRYGVAFTASMNHQPAIVGVLGFGLLAAPKLSYSLQHSRNPSIRVAAAFCLSSIGGSAGISAIRKALRSESDPCVVRFLRIAQEVHTIEIKVARGSATSSELEAYNKALVDRMLGLSCQ